MSKMETPDSSNNQKKDKYRKCSVESCGIKSSENPSLHFHVFPKPNTRTIKRENLFGQKEDIDLLEAWKKAVGIKEVHKKMLVCSLHFRKEDYFFPEFNFKRISLRRKAVPSLNLPIVEDKQVDRLKRRIKRSEAQNDNPTVVIKYNMKNENPPSVIINEKMQKNSATSVIIDNKVKDVIPAPDNDSNIQKVVAAIQNNQVLKLSITDPEVGCKVKESAKTGSLKKASNKMSIDAGIQSAPTSSLNKVSLNNLKKVNMKMTIDEGTQTYTPKSELCYNIVKIIKTDSELNTVTGIRNFELLNTITEMVKNVYGNRFEDENKKLKTRDRIILLFAKLKHDLSYSFLTILFQAHNKYIHRICDQMIEVLCTVFMVDPVIADTELKNNIPKCYETFQNIIKTFHSYSNKSDTKKVP